jgi:hypothetical protein
MLTAAVHLNMRFKHLEKILQVTYTNINLRSRKETSVWERRIINRHHSCMIIKGLTRESLQQMSIKRTISWQSHRDIWELALVKAWNIILCCSPCSISLCLALNFWFKSLKAKSEGCLDQEPTKYHLSSISIKALIKLQNVCYHSILEPHKAH